MGNSKLNSIIKEIDASDSIQKIQCIFTVITAITTAKMSG